MPALQKYAHYKPAVTLAKQAPRTMARCHRRECMPTNTDRPSSPPAKPRRPWITLVVIGAYAVLFAIFLVRVFHW